MADRRFVLEGKGAVAEHTPDRSEVRGYPALSRRPGLAATALHRGSRSRAPESSGGTDPAAWHADRDSLGGARSAARRSRRAGRGSSTVYCHLNEEHRDGRFIWARSRLTASDQHIAARDSPGA